MKKIAAESLKLASVVSVASRFGRSVNLERDFYDKVSLDGYILTSTARDALLRLSNAFSNPLAARAWTLTGTYGSGKSVFSLFVAKVFSPDSAEAKPARDLIKQHDEELWKSLFKRGGKKIKNLLPVLVSGSREPIAKALLRGLKKAIENFKFDTPRLLLTQIEDLLQKNQVISSRQVVVLFEEASQQIVSSSLHCDGLLIIVDELGKLLEYAASNPNDSDLFILQELAEATKRKSDAPIFLLTILHQAFERYVKGLSRSQKAEWKKVQGRFEDIAFQEPTEQLLRIISQAIQQKEESLTKYGEKLAREAVRLGLVNSLKKESAIEVLSKCAPLHPTVSLLLGKVFRRVGQNERSLFAFLTSPEAYGFQEFLATIEWNKKSPTLFCLDCLYDYIVTALGSSLYAQADGRKWAEIEATLNRAARASELEIKLIKTIGLLRVIGEQGNIKSSLEVLSFAFDEDVRQALTKLEKDSLVIYRRYNDTYALWEGSDINIEERLSEARTQIDPNESLAASLSKHFHPRPMPAKRHSFQKGTLRFFDARYTDLNNLEKNINDPLGEADGRILYAIALNNEEAREIEKKARANRMREHKQVIIALPRKIESLREAVFEVACLRYVRDNTPELENDRAARNELRGHLENAEARVETWIQSLLDNSQANCLWFHQGKQIQIESQRDLQEYLSKICDEVFHHTPTLLNELINRRHISSSAASARRELITAMLNHGDKPQLGIESFPPHLSMYLSLLKETGIHREQNGQWGFHPPTANSSFAAVWNEIDNFLSITEVERRTVAELFNLLTGPPFGLKEGLLPVLLCAVLLHYDTEVALYEQGSFVPALGLPVFERLTKSPETFQLQRCRIAGVRALVFEKFANTLLQNFDHQANKKPNLLTIVRPLTRFAASLPNYTRHTQSLAPCTLRVRQTLFETREPDKLLFGQLPQACGFPPFGDDDSVSKKEVERFFKQLRESLSELQRAYDDLLGKLEQMLISAFTLQSTGEEARSELRERSRRLLDLTVDPKLKSFIIRISDEELELSNWVESFATLLGGKPPTAWNDTDLARFEINLAEVTRSFLNIELLSFELNKQNSRTVHKGKEMIRLGVTTLNEPERQRVLFVSQKDKEQVEQAEISIEEAFKQIGLNGNKEFRLAVLANLSKKLLEQLDDIEQNKRKAKAAK
jgi:hypothetical protein